MKKLIVLLLLTTLAYAASAVVHAQRGALSLDEAVDNTIGAMKDKCTAKYGPDASLSNAQVVRQWDEKGVTYTMYNVEMTATCSDK
jgi:hypothetical protein